MELSASVPSLRSYKAIKVDRPLKSDTKSYISYYLPILKWLPEYTWHKFNKDLLAGITLASFQISMSISLSTLAHLPPSTGLYSLLIPPLIYCILGTVPTTVVGPQTVVSLVVGQSCEWWSHRSLEPLSTVAVIGCVSGGILFAMGVFRMGFIDNALSKAFLRGFVSSLALVMLITELLPELKLEELYAHYVAQGYIGTTTWEKFRFILEKAPENSDTFTWNLSLFTFILLMTIRYLKRHLAEKCGWKKCIFFPEILIVVVGSITLSNTQKWSELKGIKIIGDIPPNSDHIKVPVQTFSEFKELFGTSALIAMLGLFESTIVFKSVCSNSNVDASSNRELVSLGVVNLVSSIFSALPAFGGYGRSKMNISCGAQTQFSGVFVSLLAIICMNFLMNAFHHLPICILAVIISTVAFSLLEEAPADLMFYWSVGGYQELFIFIIIVVTTLVWSPQFGVTMGMCLTMIRLLKHSTRSRVQILGRDPITYTFKNIDDDENSDIPLEEIEKVMVVKIPEPLIFSNVSDLRTSLKRMEKYGSLKVHPSYPLPLRQMLSPTTSGQVSLKYLVIDLFGMTYIDISALQALREIVDAYSRRNICVMFTRPKIPDLRHKFRKSGISELQSNSIKALRLSSCATVLPRETLELVYEAIFKTIDDALEVIDILESLDSSTSYVAESGLLPSRATSRRV